MKVRVEFKVNGQDGEPELGSDAYGAADFENHVKPSAALVAAAREVAIRIPDLEPGTSVEFLILQRPG